MTDDDFNDLETSEKLTYLKRYIDSVVIHMDNAFARTGNRIKFIEEAVQQKEKA